jgi:hypothetical protein
LIIREILNADIVIRTQNGSNPECPCFISKKYKPQLAWTSGTCRVPQTGF